MPKIILAASLVAAFALAACGSPAASPIGQVPPSPIAPASPSVQPSPSEVPVVTPSPSADPTAAPTPKPTAKPTPKPLVPNTREKYLIAGVNRGAIDCKPVRTGLPARAVAGIECGADDRAVAQVGFYLFRNQDDLLKAYFARMAAEGVKPNSGDGGLDHEGENAYVPWEDNEVAPYRNGWFINDQGYANFRATIPGSHVYIGVLGRNANMAHLSDFAWKGNQDVPGMPTLWFDPTP